MKIRSFDLVSIEEIKRKIMSGLKGIIVQTIVMTLNKLTPS